MDGFIVYTVKADVVLKYKRADEFEYKCIHEFKLSLHTSVNIGIRMSTDLAF